ncbi:MarR family transcriptional regulator [Tardiphaga sp. vice304]|uniref:MarR family transcriptional regulator n=1 Tax=Tardiphaga sp. vice304 TaxID=2592817 RepID=UPI00143E041E|nr:MarR family transcriptional regulator [Tardiphaga sp. vice304]
MSIAAMNWALQQRLESHQQQILMYVITDSCDAAGVTRHCDPTYLADHARMTRATMFRRLAELEKLGLLSRFKFYSDRGAPIYEIRVNYGVVIDMPIKGRRTADDDDAEHDESDDTGTADGELNDRPKSHSETLVEPTKVSPRASPESHCCDSISPPLSKNLPPTPLRGASLSKIEVEQGEKRDGLFAAFRTAYPLASIALDPGPAREELDALSVEDAEWAISSAPHYAAELRKAGQQRPKNAHLWLRKRMFENFARGAPAPATAVEQVWVADGSNEDRAVRFVFGLTRAIVPFVRTEADRGRGYFLKARVGLDMLAMLGFADDDDRAWTPLPRTDRRCAAWQERFTAWSGRPLPLVRLPDGADGIRVPGPWPPKKDGTVYRHDTETQLGEERADAHSEGSDHA